MNCRGNSEAGTPNIAGPLDCAAIDYLEEIGMENIHQHEQEIVAVLLPKMQEMEGVTVYGPSDPEKHSGVISFTHRWHPSTTSQRRSIWKVAVRAGHHCAQPLMRWLDVPATCRARFYIITRSKQNSFRSIRKSKGSFSIWPYLNWISFIVR